MANDLVPSVDGHLEVTAPTALEAVSRAEIEQQITTARRFPRSIAQAREDALSLAKIDQKVAESCYYRLKRGNKTIEGPSIRLAEIVASAWGNLRVGSRIVNIDDRFVTAQGYAKDVQRNNEFSVEVSRRITDSAGRTFNEDMIGVTAGAARAIALRNAIFQAVPRAFVDSVLEEVKKVARGDEKSLATRRTAMIGYFEKMGVSKAKLLAKLSTEDHPVKGVDDIGLDQLDDLRGIAEGIKDGAFTLEDAFAEEKPAQTAAAQLGENLKAPEPPAKQKPQEQQKPPEPEKQAAAADTQKVSEGELEPEKPVDQVASGGGSTGDLFGEKTPEQWAELIKADIEACRTSEALTALAKAIKAQPQEIAGLVADAFNKRKRFLREKEAGSTSGV